MMMLYNQTMQKIDKSWHEAHAESMTRAQRIADKLASVMGSWMFIVTQTVFVAIWMVLNFVAYMHHWDPYPFILLNLLFSTQAAYAAPIIMMSQNRQNERDREQARNDYETNLEAKAEIEALQLQLSQIETQKLDKILALLEGSKVSSSAGLA
jgi:uncharacterized membrane protein